MFGFLNRRTREVKAPVDGQVIALEEVNDEVFSRGLAGDGVAINPVSGTFAAPIDGVVSKIFRTNHAYSIKGEKELEVLVHIGLDTVKLEGRGFERVVNEGDRVQAGDTVIQADLAYLREHAKGTVTPIIISDESDVKEVEKRLNIVKCGDVIMEVK